MIVLCYITVVAQYMRSLIIPVAMFLCLYCAAGLNIFLSIFFFLWEEHGLRVAENRVLKICGPKKDEVTGEW